MEIDRILSLREATMLRKTIAASLLAAAALAPAAAHASGAHLGGQPAMRLVDAHHATLELAADRLPRTAKGAVDARVQFAGGQRVSALKPAGRHGYDVRYTATVTSRSNLRVGAKYTVRIRLAGSAPVVRLVKLHAAR
jgi:hypothetical protein